MQHKSAALWCSKEVEIITGGQSSMPWHADAIAIRETDVMSGDLFLASPGDDLEFIYEMGANAAMVPAGMTIPDFIAERLPIIRVACVFEAMRTLARAARFRTHSLVIAVQGFEQRRDFARALSAVSDTFEAGRHLSSGMASIPELCDFSVFGPSPSLRPDVAVIDKCSRTKDLGVIEAMPDNGILLVNADDPAHMDIVARGRAAGLRNILTYGTNAMADSYVSRTLIATDGAQLSASILGQDIVMQAPSHTAPHMPNMAQNHNMLMAAMLIAKLSDMKLDHVASYMASAYMSPFDTSDQDLAQDKIALLPSSAGQWKEAIFQVKNMIDVGQGRKTLILDQGAPSAQDRDFILPSRLGGLNVLCATKKVSIFDNARKAMQNILRTGPLNTIVPEVLTPGDYVVFKSGQNPTSSVFSEALRVG